MRDAIEGLTIIDDKVQFVVAGMLIEIEMDPEELRGFAVALALLADKREGKESPPIAKFLGGEVAGNA